MSPLRVKCPDQVNLEKKEVIEAVTVLLALTEEHGRSCPEPAPDILHIPLDEMTFYRKRTTKGKSL